MIIYDMEAFKHDWMGAFLDTRTRQWTEIINEKDKLEDFYYKNRDVVWVGYNNRGYDQWIVKGILCDFNPYDISDWIINKKRQGFEFSKLLNKFPMINYDVSIFGRSLKQLEAFMGHDIRETSVPFDIDRKLIEDEKVDTMTYCRNDVMETFEIMIETADTYNTQMDIVIQNKLQAVDIGKTQTQLTALVLGATKRNYDDEFDIEIVPNIRLGKYEYLRDEFINWSRNIKDYKWELEVDIAGVPHKLGFGGLHGARKNYISYLKHILADVESYYPSLIIKYDWFSRSIPDWGKKLYTDMYHHRLKLKAQGKKKEQAPHKLILNKKYGGLKDKYSTLYDPRQANNICINGQLFLIDLIDKLEEYCSITQSNTDGVMFVIKDERDKRKVFDICNEWSKRSGMNLGYDVFKAVFQKDVNNYISVAEDGSLERLGGFVKKTHKLDNDLPIVGEAIVNYFVHNIPVEQTIMNEDSLIKFQKVSKLSSKYEHAIYDGKILTNKVYRTFATTGKGAVLLKKHHEKDKGDKVGSTPMNCIIINRNIEGEKVFPELDKQWYIDLAKHRVQKFIAG